ncbi:MAG: anti-sigma factor [Candidatus Omnitrophica bacterium]|nr:anti-sigma factor [Candidatus Omnitrophota bacterium]
MSEKFEELVKLLYRRAKKRSRIEGEHPDDETFACFLDGVLPSEESERIKTHLLTCESCAEILALSLNSEKSEALDVPEELLCRVRALLDAGNKLNVFEILLRLKENVFEVINTTGDILMGQELIPAPVLRSRNIKDFKGEVVILKNIGDKKIEVRIENKGDKYFNVIIKVADKRSQDAIKDLRVSLFKDNLELESYSGAVGPVVFEHILLGRYSLEVLSDKGKLASIILDIKG